MGRRATASSGPQHALLLHLLSHIENLADNASNREELERFVAATDAQDLMSIMASHQLLSFDARAVLDILNDDGPLDVEALGCYPCAGTRSATEACGELVSAGFIRQGVCGSYEIWGVGKRWACHMAMVDR